MKQSEDVKYLGYSIAFHVALFIVFAVKVFVFPNTRPQYERSVRVDFISLPDKDPVEGPQGAAEKPPEPEKPKEPPKEEPPPKKQAPKEQVFSEKMKKSKDPNVKDKQSDALKRLEAFEKIKKLKEQKAANEGTQYKGNVVSQGASLTGVEKLQHDQYLEKLDQQIKHNWHLPEWLTNKNFTAILIVRFDERGTLLDRKLIRSSGNASFDNQALEAVTNSAPFPAPPESLVSYFKVRGIELRFPE